jgi:nucleoside-diphosphate-sugar epimerase
MGKTMAEGGLMQTLILGCGFVGTAFGQAMLARGSVTGTCRSAEGAKKLEARSITPLIYDGTQNESLRDIVEGVDIVLACIPPTPHGDEAFAALSDTLSRAPPSWIGYLSTTGVYGDRQGGWAFEDDALTPLSLEAARRVTAEAQWASLQRPAHVFRLPGIYGPGRCALEQVKAGTARRIDRKGQIFSRAHRDDIVAALLASIAAPNPGRAYNVCDDLPCPSGDVIVEACRLLGKTPPPLIAFAEAGLSEMGQRFYKECKRVSNARVKSELGWRPQFPTYVEGLADCLARR